MIIFFFLKLGFFIIKSDWFYVESIRSILGLGRVEGKGNIGTIYFCLVWNMFGVNFFWCLDLIISEKIMECIGIGKGDLGELEIFIK